MEKDSDPLTPSKEAQAFLILQGKCPHNEGWYYKDMYFDVYDDNIYYVYKCRKCGQLEFY